MKNGKEARKTGRREPAVREFLGNLEEWDFDKVVPFQCNILRKKGEELYMVALLGEEGDRIKNIPAVRVETWKFLVRRYRWFVAIYLTLGLLYLLSFPIYAIAHYALLLAILKFYRPYENIRKIMLLQRFVVAYILGILGFSLYKMFFSHAFLGSVSTLISVIQGFMFGAMMLFVSIPFFALFEKYGKVFALEVTDPKRWKESGFFVWEKKLF